MVGVATSKSKDKKRRDSMTGLVASNRRARREYEILDTVEAGMVLHGSEVKSLRDGNAQLADAYARVERDEMWLHNLHIPHWQTSAGFGAHQVDRSRKLLLHRHEIERLGSRIAQERLTLVPLSIYFSSGRAKIELALARGKKLHDKRETIKRRDADREAERAMSAAVRRRRR